MSNIPYTRQHAAAHTGALIAFYLGLSDQTAGRFTDLNIGSNVRELYESVALRLEALDNDVYIGLRDAIPEILYEWFGPGDGLTTTVGFPLLPALPAMGPARFTLAADAGPPVTIPAGTRLVGALGTAGVTYATVGTVTLLTGTTVDTTIAASVAGPAGSVQANGLVLLDAVTGIASATNLAQLVGIPAETDEQRRQRFLVYVRNLARAQLEGLDAGALTAQVVVAGEVVEHVLVARAIDVPNKRGLVDLFIDNGNALASPALVTACQQIIDGYRDALGVRVAGYKAAGIVVRVQPVQPVVVPVTLAVWIDPLVAWGAVVPLVQAAISGYFTGLGIAADVVLAELSAAVATVPGVVDVQFTTPTANLSGRYGARYTLGVVTLLQGGTA